MDFKWYHQRITYEEKLKEEEERKVRGVNKGKGSQVMVFLAVLENGKYPREGWDGLGFEPCVKRKPWRGSQKNQTTQLRLLFRASVEA